MDCASNTSMIETSLNKVKGVKNVITNYVTETSYVEYEDTVNVEELIQAVKDAGYSAEYIE